jgi:membrane protease YdiL (CAAX protease family)
MALPDEPLRIETPAAWAKLLAGLTLVFLLFHGCAHWLGSDRGQAGLLVAAVVLATLLAVERLLLGASRRRAVHSLGLGTPDRRGMACALAVTAALLAVIPVFSAATGVPIPLSRGWAGFVPGLFAQAGIAEEALFRAYLFGHLRVTRTFWAAATLSLLPFVAVHLPLFFTMAWPLAAAALVLAAATALPFARLYDLGGATIWAPAVLHTVIQGTVKVIDVPEEWALRFALLWMAASAVLPFAVFAASPREQGGRPSRTLTAEQTT